jgi:hypothetical protein
MPEPQEAMSESGNLTPAEAKARGFDPATIRRLESEALARSEALLLIPEIEAAFSGVERPWITLRVARAYDDEWNLTDERIVELRARDPEEDWREIGDHAIGGTDGYFTFSDPAGWRFYLPAFMCHYLRHFPGSDCDAIILACRRRTHFDLLDDAQLQCIEKFMEFCNRAGTRSLDHEHDLS